MGCSHIEGEDGAFAIITTNQEPDEFPRDRWIATGFGSAGLYRDGVMVADGSPGSAAVLTGAEAESMAARDPDRKWEIVICGPLSGAVWRREGKEIGRWICVEQLGGFA